MTTPAPEVSGRAFVGILRHVKREVGEAELKRVIGGAPDDTQRALAARIAHTVWFPYSAFAGFLSTLDVKLGRGDPNYARSLGTVAGQSDLGTVFRVYVALASTERLIRGCSRVWPAYYRNCGQMDAIAWAPEKTVLRISGFPQMSPVHCRLMEGWMLAAMKTIGAEVLPGARETSCASRGSQFHEFTCSWRKA